MKKAIIDTRPKRKHTNSASPKNINVKVNPTVDGVVGYRTTDASKTSTIATAHVFLSAIRRMKTINTDTSPNKMDMAMKYMIPATMALEPENSGSPGMRGFARRVPKTLWQNTMIPVGITSAAAVTMPIKRSRPTKGSRYFPASSLLQLINIPGQRRRA